MKVLTHGFCTSFHFQNHHSGRSALLLENGLNLFNDTFADALCLFIRLICNNIDLQAPVVQTSDSAIHRINHYPADSVIDFRNTYPLVSDLSGG